MQQPLQEQLLQEQKVPEQQVLAELQLPESVHGSLENTAIGYKLHPSLMDAVFQSALAVMVTDAVAQGQPLKVDKTWVPFELAVCNALRRP